MGAGCKLQEHSTQKPRLHQLRFVTGQKRVLSLFFQRYRTTATPLTLLKDTCCFEVVMQAAKLSRPTPLQAQT